MCESSRGETISYFFDSKGEKVSKNRIFKRRKFTTGIFWILRRNIKKGTQKSTFTKSFDSICVV